MAKFEYGSTALDEVYWKWELGCMFFGTRVGKTFYSQPVVSRRNFFQIITSMDTNLDMESGNLPT